MRGQGRAARIGIGIALGTAGLLIGYRALARGSDEATLKARAAYPPLDLPKAIGDGIWIVDGEPIRASGLMLPVRMTVVRLGDGGLLLHSPTRLTPNLREALGEIGEVRHLVAPNIAHWTFLADWQRAFPEATTWGAPGLRDRAQVRRSPVRIDRDLGETPPPQWADTLDQGSIVGGAGFHEVYFFHRPTRTLLLVDLVQNLEPEKLPAATRILMCAAAATDGTTPLYLRAVLRFGGEPARAAVGQMLALAPERVIFAHGDYFVDHGAERLARALAWLV